jgi:hypothetical protein
MGDKVRINPQLRRFKKFVIREYTDERAAELNRIRERFHRWSICASGRIAMRIGTNHGRFGPHLNRYGDTPLQVVRGRVRPDRARFGLSRFHFLDESE